MSGAGRCQENFDAQPAERQEDDLGVSGMAGGKAQEMNGGSGAKYGELVKLFVPLPKSDWHSHATESVWAEPVGLGEYRLMNVPFYAKDLSFEDVVSARRSAEGTLELQQVVRRSGHSTYRLYLQEGLTPEAVEFLQSWDPLQKLGCTFEQATDRLLAADIPPQADIDQVYELLQAGEAAGVWDFEEGHCGHPLRQE